MKTLKQQMDSVAREIALRKRVYPKWILAGRISEAKAKHEIKCMESVLDTLTKQNNQPDLFEGKVWPD